MDCHLPHQESIKYIILAPHTKTKLENKALGFVQEYNCSCQPTKLWN